MTLNGNRSTLSLEPAKSRAEQLADTLHGHIRDNDFRPGQHFGTLDQIRDQVGLARTTVSEAVRLLRERGILEIRPGRGGGIFIAEPTPLIRMRHTLLSVEGSPDLVREAVELRETLEEPIALGASVNYRLDDVARLRNAAQAIGEGDLSYNEFLKRNWRLHEVIAEINPNKTMSAVYVSCLGYLAKSSTVYSDLQAERDYIAERSVVHVELVEAILSRDESLIRPIIRKHNNG